MNEARETQEKPQRPLGVLSCLMTGFETVARNPAIVIMPVLLDVWLWLGPRLSLAPLLIGFERELGKFASMDAVPEAAVENARFIIQTVQIFEERFNLFSSLQSAPLLGVPALFTNAKLWSVARPFGVRPDMDVVSIFGYIGWQILLLLVGLGFSSIYLRSVGLKVIEETDSPLPGPERSWNIWKQMVALGGMLYLGFMSLGAAIFTITAMFGMVNDFLGFAVLMLGGSLLLFIVTHLLFTVPGIVLLRRGVLRAIKESIMLARADFTGVTFLFTAIIVVNFGLNMIWTLPEPGSWAMLVGIGGHAFTSTALIATLFVFYQDRLRFIRALQQAYAAQTQAQEAS